ncbi:hypothetical protein VTN02DRAFT_1884 [Thermoascus thermophilus]
MPSSTTTITSILPSPLSLQLRTTLLPLLPLITSTGTLTYAYAETLFLTPLADDGEQHRVPEPVIRTVWQRVFYPGLGAILTFGAGSLVGGVAGYRMSIATAGKGKDMAAVLYASGTALAMVHFGFVPWIAKTIEAMIDPTDEKSNRKRENQKRWLELHRVRTLVSDIPAFVAFLGATSAYFLA